MSNELWSEEDELSYQIGFDKPIFTSEKTSTKPQEEKVDSADRPDVVVSSVPFYEQVVRTTK